MENGLKQLIAFTAQLSALDKKYPNLQVPQPEKTALVEVVQKLLKIDPEAEKMKRKKEFEKFTKLNEQICKDTLRIQKTIEGQMKELKKARPKK